MSRFLWLLIEAHHMRQLLSGFFLQYNEKGGTVRKVGCKVAGRSRLIIGTKSCPGFFQQHRLLAKVLLLRWPFNIASLAKCPIMLRNRIFRLIRKRHDPFIEPLHKCLLLFD